MFYKYMIKFSETEEQVIDIQIDSHTLTASTQEGVQAPDWARLEFCKCSICPYGSETEFCPIAANLAEVTRIFSDKASVDNVEVKVISHEREYFKKTSLQNALSSIIGLYMATSGCRVMDTLKPMARHHLPFATLEETAFRAVSTYLLQQYKVKQKGGQPDWDLNELRKAYKDIEILNLAITERVRKSSTKDANYNAVIILDAFAKMVPFSIDRGLPN